MQEVSYTSNSVCSGPSTPIGNIPIQYCVISYDTVSHDTKSYSAIYCSTGSVAPPPPGPPPTMLPTIFTKIGTLALPPVPPSMVAGEILCVFYFLMFFYGTLILDYSRVFDPFVKKLSDSAFKFHSLEIKVQQELEEMRKSSASLVDNESVRLQVRSLSSNSVKEVPQVNPSILYSVLQNPEAPHYTPSFFKKILGMKLSNSTTRSLINYYM